MRVGSRGKSGRVGNEPSITYKPVKPLLLLNPTLTATPKGLLPINALGSANGTAPGDRRPLVRGLRTVAVEETIDAGTQPMSESSATDQAAVRSMASNPGPNHHVFVFHGKRSVVQADPSGPRAAYLLEAQGWVLRVA